MMLVVNIISSFFVAFVMTSLTELISHKYILHGLGKKKGSWFSYHINHHRVVRKDYIDPDYKAGFFKSSPYRREVLSLFLLFMSNISLLWVWPMLFYWLAFFTVAYFWGHSKSHTNPKWGMKYMRWHYDHHRFHEEGNWGVTSCFIDYVLGTRYKGTYDEDGKPIRTKHQMVD